jgi:D-tyrosyl-tRNA(Tyr) deacylase
VSVEGNEVNSIGSGLLVLLGVAHDDTHQDAVKLAKKIKSLRIFEDEEGKMNRSIAENQEILCISQFTLYGDCRKGNRPSFIAAARPEKAQELYEHVCELLGAKRGIFQTFMQVELVNDGPTTILIDIPDP